jgi:glycosyltransferase involved in cell wall biosynthesis
MTDLPLKVLIFVPTVDQTGALGAGGAERMARNLCIAFDRAKIEPALLTLKEAGAVGEELRAKGVETYLLKKRGKIDPVFWLNFRSIIKSGRFDAALSMLQGANFHNLLVTPTVKETACIIRLARVNVPRKISAIEGRLASRADLLIVNARQTGENAVSSYRIRENMIRVIPNGCDEERFKYVPFENRFSFRERLGISKDAYLIYSAGRIHADKGFDLLAESLVSLPIDIRKKILWINTGATQDQAAYQKIISLIETTGISAKLLSAVTNTEEYISACDLVVIPSRTEAFPNVLLESGSVGRPVVATRTGEVPRVGGILGGVALAEIDAESIGAAIKKVMEIPESDIAGQTMRMSENTRLHFGMSVVASLYADSIKEACRHRQSRSA